MHAHNTCVIKMKKNVTIRIDGDLVKKAKDLGLNISKVAENALKDMIRRIEGSKSSTSNENKLDKVRWWGRPNLNRGPESPSLRAWTKLADGPSLCQNRGISRFWNLTTL